MAANTMMLKNRSMTPTFAELSGSTPGSAFLVRKPSFSKPKKEDYHYKLNLLDSNYLTPRRREGRRRTTMDIRFTVPENDIDPYVSASNWLPKFKTIIQGHLARERTKKLREKHRNMKIIQKACREYLDPWMTLYREAGVLAKPQKIDDIRKALRDCVLQIKRLVSTQIWVDTRIGDVNQVIDQSIKITTEHCIPETPYKDISSFKEINNINYHANQDFLENPVIQNVLKLELPELEDVEKSMDTTLCDNIMVHQLIEKSQRLLEKIHHDRHDAKSLFDQKSFLEKNIDALRNEIDQLKINNMEKKESLKKSENFIENLNEKITHLEKQIEGLENEKVKLRGKIQDFENKESRNGSNIQDMENRLEEMRTMLVTKSDQLEHAVNEKSKLETSNKELKDIISYSNENQQELESQLKYNKSRMNELKKRLMDQIKTLEDEITQKTVDFKEKIKCLEDTNEFQAIELNRCHDTINTLKRDLNFAADRDGSDDEMDAFPSGSHVGERELKITKEKVDQLEEELRLVESRYEESKHTIAELQEEIDKVNKANCDLKGALEREKGNTQTVKNQLSSMELKLNKAVRERTGSNMKIKQFEERCHELEKERSQLVNEAKKKEMEEKQRKRELELVQSDINSVKREHDARESLLKNRTEDLERQLVVKEEKIHKAQEENRQKVQQFTTENEDLKSQLDDKEDKIIQLENEVINKNREVKRLQRQVKESEETQMEYEAQIKRLKDERKTLEDQAMNPISNFSADYSSWDRRRGMDSPISSPSASDIGYNTLPTSGSSKQTF